MIIGKDKIVKKINVRVRLIVIHDKKVLVQYREKDKYYHYIGGHLEYGEIIKKACIRETKEECGNDVNFEFQKKLYVRDFIKPKEYEHSVELFILGNIDKTKGLEGFKDPEHSDGSFWLTWLDIYNLPDILLPKSLSQMLLADYKNNFPIQGKYVGEIE